MAVAPPRKPKLAELVPTAPCRRTQAAGRRTKPRLAPSGRPTSVARPNKRGDAGAAGARVAVSATATSSRAAVAASARALGGAKAIGAGWLAGGETIGVLTTGAGRFAGRETVGVSTAGVGRTTSLEGIGVYTTDAGRSAAAGRFAGAEGVGVRGAGRTAGAGSIGVYTTSGTPGDDTGGRFAPSAGARPPLPSSARLKRALARFLIARSYLGPGGFAA